MEPEPEQWSPLVEPIWLLLLHPLGLPLWQVAATGGGEGGGGEGGGREGEASERGGGQDGGSESGGDCSG